jgi:hypothetical protein
MIIAKIINKNNIIKIKGFKVKNFLVKRITKRTEKIEVGFNHIKPKDIRAMPKTQLKAYALEMYRLTRTTSTLEPAVTWYPQNTQEIIVENEIIPIRHQNSTKKETVPCPAISDALIGRKAGKTSKYHYVHWNTKNQQWRAAVKILNKTNLVGSFNPDDEKRAAFAIDSFLDGFGDVKRPRNRDEHPEIMEMYNDSKDNK